MGGFKLAALVKAGPKRHRKALGVFSRKESSDFCRASYFTPRQTHLLTNRSGKDISLTPESGL